MLSCNRCKNFTLQQLKDGRMHEVHRVQYTTQSDERGRSSKRLMNVFWEEERNMTVPIANNATHASVAKSSNGVR